MSTYKQLELFPHCDEKKYDVNNPMAAEDLGNIENYPEEIQKQIMDVFEMFDFSGREETNPRIIYGIACLSGEDIEKLNKVQEKGLKINSYNIFPIVGTPLEDKDIQTLIDWQKHGIEVKTREMLFGMLSGYNGDSAAILMATYGGNMEEYLNKYFKNNGILKEGLAECNMNDSLCSEKYLTFQDLRREYSNLDLARLFFYLNIVDSNEFSVYDLLNEIKKYNYDVDTLRCLYELYHKPKISVYQLHKILNRHYEDI